MGFFDDLRELRDVTTRQIESLGGVYGDPFNEIATIVAVSDPKKLGRVKVQYQDDSVSDWIYVFGSNKGLLSSQFVGSTCLVGKANGNSEDAFVLGFFSKDPDTDAPGAPIQFPIISEQLDSSRLPSSPGDNGLRCNEGNAGKCALFENEFGQTPRICKKSNSRQEGGEDEWAWCDFVPSLVIEKGVDPATPVATGTTSYAKKTGIEQCTKALEGQTREFAEDRKFSRFTIKCSRDENGEYTWSPANSPPRFNRVTLPDCSEKLHGVDAILEDGLNSQGIKCLRYQGSMKWTYEGKREPIQFHRQDIPLSREQFISSRGPIKALASTTSSNLVNNFKDDILQQFISSIVPFSQQTQLGIGSNLNPLEFLQKAGNIALSSGLGVSPSQITELISSALINGNEVPEELGVLLSAAGNIGDIVANGIKNNSLDQALTQVGQSALLQSLDTLSPELYSLYTSFASGGTLGVVDSAVGIGLDKLPPEISAYISPAMTLGQGILASKASSISDVLNAAIGNGSKSLPQVVEGILSVARGGGDLIPTQAISNVLNTIGNGELGEVAKLFGDFKELPALAKIPGAGNIPQLASTSLELIGLGKDFANLTQGGIGISGVTTLLGSNPVSAILGGVSGLRGLIGSFGVGGGDCPCGTKCRKIKHTEDSDGNVLLEPCGNVVANSASSYNPTGDVTENNKNVVAQVLDLIPTDIGQKLCYPNPYDLTQLIKNVKRLDEMADRIESAKNADWPELWNELVYTFEAIEKAFKQTDNNITGVESIERKLIDAQHRLITKLMDGNGSFFSKALLSIIDTSKAVQDLYRFVLKLDAKKKGGRAGVFPTQSLKIVFENITKIALLNSASKKEAKSILSQVVTPADREWKKLEPGGELLDLANVILGAIPKDVPLNFSKCLTKRDKNKVLKDSLESKINSPVKPEPSSLLEATLSSNQKDKLNSISAISEPLSITGRIIDQSTRDDTTGTPSLLDQIKFEQLRAERGEAEC